MKSVVLCPGIYRSIADESKCKNAPENVDAAERDARPGLFLFQTITVL
jgi:hypothetical protein